VPLIAVIRYRIYIHGAFVENPSDTEVVPLIAMLPIGVWHAFTPSFEHSIRIVADIAPVPVSVAWKVVSGLSFSTQSPVLTVVADAGVATLTVPDLANELITPMIVLPVALHSV
jgi:hypothetical protein